MSSSQPTRDRTGRYPTAIQDTVPSPFTSSRRRSKLFPTSASNFNRSSRTKNKLLPPPHRSPTPERIDRHMTAPVPTTKRAKLNTANLSFSGKKSEFRGWMDAITLHMIGNADQFPDDKAKVTFVLSYMDKSNKVRLWAGNELRKYEEPYDYPSESEAAEGAPPVSIITLPYEGGWPTWREFKIRLEAEFGDPAAREQAEEHLIVFRQGNLDARAFFNSLELWYDLAGVIAPEAKFRWAKKSMNPQLRTSLIVAGFPPTYEKLKEKMVQLEDEERKTNPVINPRGLDERFTDAGPSNRAHSTATYRVQGHVPVKPRQDWNKLKKQPPGTRPKPNYGCFECRKQGLGDLFHWRDECPRQRQTPRPGPSQPPANQQRAPHAAQNRAPQHPNKGKGRRFGNQPRRNDQGHAPPQPFRRQANTDALEDARRALESLPTEVRRGFLVKQAKDMDL